MMSDVDDGQRSCGNIKKKLVLQFRLVLERALVEFCPHPGEDLFRG